MPVDLHDIRAVETQGGFNLRDFGGYATVDGRRVKRGMLFRSGTMTMLDADDEVRLRALGIRVICDLRRKDERHSAPTRWHENIAGVEYWARDYDESSGNLTALARSEETSADMLRAAMLDVYRRIPSDHAESYKRIFRQLADHGGPLLVNCTAGKDRTGVAAALILTALGCSRADVTRDYIATNQFADWPKMFAFRQSRLARKFGENPDALAPLLSAETVYLETMFETLDEQHGGFEAYLAERLGVDDAALARMKDALLEAWQ